MKRIGLHLLAVTGALVLLASCGTTREAVEVADVTYERLDWQGRATGSPVPEWVLAVGDNNKREVVKQLDLSDYMVWSFNASGEDLEFLENWTDKVELQSNVAQSVSSSIGRATQASLQAQQSIDETVKDKTLTDVTTVLSNVRVNGLEKIASYWIKTRSALTAKPAADADWEVKYTYYSVWALKKELYEEQIDAAIKGIDENTAQDEALMELISASIKKTILDDEGADVFTLTAEEPEAQF